VYSPTDWTPKMQMVGEYTHPTRELFMPIYEYTCKSCKKSFEQLVKSMTAAENVKCPACGSKQTDRSLSVFAVGSAALAGGQSAPGMCGRCGGPGPCAN
jgi:putative FmdB family regulatory protein